MPQGYPQNRELNAFNAQPVVAEIDHFAHERMTHTASLYISGHANAERCNVAAAGIFHHIECHMANHSLVKTGDEMPSSRFRRDPVMPHIH